MGKVEKAGYVATKFRARSSVYDKDRADRAVNFIECLSHSKGEWHGKNFKLLPWQEQIIRDIFGTIKEDGFRQFNTAYIEIPKKQGKSELAAAVALYLLCGDGEWGAEIYGCAADRQQAGIVFNVACEMINLCPPLKKKVKIIPSQKRIVFSGLNSFYQVLSAESYTKHGLNVHGIVFDELHAQPTRKHDATFELFKAEAFLPTAKGGFAKPAEAILVGSEKLVELLNANDINILFKGRCKWLDASITSTSKATKDIYFFIRDTLKAIDVDLAVFARSVTDEFLASKGDKWLIKFYKLLASSPFAMGIIKDKAVVRLESGKMVAPFTGDTPNAHLQREGMKPTAKSVKHIFCEDNDALEFLGFFGVTTADADDDIRDFTSEFSKCKDEADYLLVMELIADAYNDKDTTDDKRRRIAAILQDEFCILCDDESREKQERHKPADAFYRHNGIETIYKGIPNWYVCDSLVAKGNADGTFERFLTALGVNSSILIVEQKNILTWQEQEALRGQAP